MQRHTLVGKLKACYKTNINTEKRESLKRSANIFHRQVSRTVQFGGKIVADCLAHHNVDLDSTVIGVCVCVVSVNELHRSLSWSGTQVKKN